MACVSRQLSTQRSRTGDMYESNECCPNLTWPLLRYIKNGIVMNAEQGMLCQSRSTSFVVHICTVVLSGMCLCMLCGAQLCVSIFNVPMPKTKLHAQLYQLIVLCYSRCWLVGLYTCTCTMQRRALLMNGLESNVTVACSQCYSHALNGHSICIHIELA